jgi:hypothetical protein
MPHADEGQIHAYLDRQGEFADPVKRRELGKHIADCSACTRVLKEARRVRADAEELLRTTRVREVQAPPFAEIAARAQSRKQPAAVGVAEADRPLLADDEQEPASHATRRQFRVWRSLAWAATIVLAIGVGWSVRPLLIDPSRPPQAMGFEDAASESVGASEPPARSDEMAQTAAPRREAEAPAAPDPAPAPPGAAMADDDAAKVAEDRAEAFRPTADSEQVTLATAAIRTARERRSAAVDSAIRIDTTPALRQVAAQPAPTSTGADSGIVATITADSVLAERLAERELARARDSNALAGVANAAPRGEVVSMPLTFESDRSRLPGDWNVISREEAERMLGGPLVWVPELAIVGLGRTEAGSGVRLMQSAGSGAILEMEIRAIVPATAGDSRTSRPMRIRAMQGAETNASTGTATIGRYLITAKAGFPEASLRGLLQQLTYAPAADQLRDH